MTLTTIVATLVGIIIMSLIAAKGRMIHNKCFIPLVKHLVRNQEYVKLMRSFTAEDVKHGKLSLKHNLGSNNIDVTIVTNLNNKISPTSYYIEGNEVHINLEKQGPVTGTWYVYLEGTRSLLKCLF